MGFAGFTPASAAESVDSKLLSRWAGVDVGEHPTTVIEAAERRIQLHELSRRQLRVLLVKLGGADAGASEHLQMDMQALLGAAREAMGAAPLVLLDEACSEPSPSPLPLPPSQPYPSPPTSLSPWL